VIRAIVDQPAAARVCLVESHAAGPQAEEAIERALAPFGELVAETLGMTPRADAPRQREGAGKPAGAGAAFHLHHAGPVRRPR
jgi:hypothetical protein